MNLFCGLGVLGGLILVSLAGCSGAAQEASNNTAPVAQQVAVSTSSLPAHVGSVLQGNYRFADADGDGESGTVKVWLRDGQPVEGANSDNYTVTAKDSGKKLKFRITPAAATGKSPGAAAESPEVTIENRAPSIIGLTILSSAANEVYLGVVLSASYGFQDPDGDDEGVSTYQWQRNGNPIGGATTQSYTVTGADIGNTLAVQVTPKDNVVPAQFGTPVVSDPVTVALASSTGVVLTVSSSLKQLHFSWAPVLGASSYRLSYTPDGVSSFVSLSAASDMLTTTSYAWDIAVHRINWRQTQFRVEACKADICITSASISALGVMANAIGYFKASNTGAGDYFGYSVALSADGNTLAVGAWLEDSAAIDNPLDDCGVVSPANCAANSGAVYIYMRNGTLWSQQAYVKASNPGANDWFGWSVSLSADGNTLAVGAPSEESNTTGINSSPNNLAISAGAVYVYSRNGTTWSQQAFVKASNTESGDNFGHSVALSGDGNTLAVGANGENSSTTGVNSLPNNSLVSAGAAYVYTRNSTTWVQVAYVKASNPSINDNFGYSVALSGDGNTLAVGANWEDSSTTGINSTPNESAPDAGAVYIYSHTGITWTQQAYVKASNTESSDNFGSSVALSADGNTLAVGAQYEDSGTTGVNSTPNESAPNSGAAYIYTRTGITWLQQAYVKASNTGAGDNFGRSFALSADGNTLAVGASGEAGANTGVIPGAPDEIATPNGLNSGNSGAVYVYVRNSSIWSQQAYVKASNIGANDYFGNSVALSADGSTLAVGAFGEDGSSSSVNSVPNESALDAGAVYLY